MNDSSLLMTLEKGQYTLCLPKKNVRCLLVSLLLCVLIPAGHAQTTYYVAADGNDNNDGRSTGGPFRSLGKINNLNLQAGDQVLFRRGDTFRGTLAIRRSGSSGQPIVYDAYGSGNKPVLSGAVTITGWSDVGGNVWQANCSTCGNRVTGLYWSGSPLPLGRYPNYSDSNKGYLTIQAHQDRYQVTSREGLGINLNTGWSGTEVVVRANQWIIDRYNFEHQYGNSLNLTGTPSGYPISDEWGFFIQNHPATLDQPGEWAFNASTKTVRLYSPNRNPNDQTLTATVQDKAVDLSNVSNVMLRNLRFAEGLSVSLYVNNGSNLVFSNVDVLNSGEDGVSITGSGQAILLENSLIYNANNNGIRLDAYQNVTLRGNTIRRIGVVPGRGKSADGQYNGISSEVKQNLLLESNTVDSIGYNAISFATNSTIQRNVVSHFCIAKSDGGGIYTWNGNGSRAGSMQILANIVSNSIGAPEGTPGGAYSGANGIYLDDCTLNAQVNDNTVFNCNGFGIYLHATNGASLNNNTVYNNVEAQLAILPAGGCSARNNNILNNILVSRLPDQLVGKYESNQNDVAQYGNFDYNYYLRPWEDEQKIRVIYNNGGYTGGHLTLAQWQNLYGKDRNSKNSPITYASSQSPDENIRLVTNPAGQDLAVSLPGNYRDPRGKTYSGSVTLAPFTSLVLLKDNGTLPTAIGLREPENPANAVAGLDYSYYEGSWTALPDFTTLTAVETGTAAVPDLKVSNQPNFFGLRFTGYINVPTEGTYTFYVNSDDGSKLFIGSTEVINHDGTHPQTEKSGSIGLKAGNHAITILYFESAGGEGLSVSYSGPNLGKQVIPASAFYRVGSSSGGSGTGLRAEYFNNSSLAVPVVFTRTDAVIDFNWGNGSPGGSVNSDNYSVRWSGQVEAPANGRYTFSTNSDDGVRLWVDNQLLIDNWSVHPPAFNNGGITLTGGQKYAIRLEYFENREGAVIQLQWTYPGQDQQIVPQSHLYPTASGNRAGATAAVTEREENTTRVDVEAPVVYPVPARDEVRVRYYAEVAGMVTLQLINPAAQVVTTVEEPVVRGENHFKLGVEPFNRGLYILTLTQGGRRISRKVLLSD